MTEEVRQKPAASTFSGQTGVENKQDELFWQGELAPSSPSDPWNVLETVLQRVEKVTNHRVTLGFLS